MLFNSFGFLVFFVVVTSLYFILPQKAKLPLLLLSSCLFYMTFIPIFILLLFGVILIDYATALSIESSKRRKDLFLFISIFSNCSILFLFKYFNFFNSNVSVLAHFIGWNYPIQALNLILPLGLSFHTFQSISYVVEVYRGKQKAEKNLGIYALYVLFYPKLIAGPIERPQHLLHQFYEKHDFDYQRVTNGLKLMLWGFFKKVVIADRLAILVNQVYKDPYLYHGPPLVIAAIFFAYELYCDFSGYTDIARGAARVMGFELMDNFNHPFSSKSMSEFWRRWHISLSTWINDYLYANFVIRRRHWGRWGVVYALLLTFLIIGLWHGANWTFVIFGGLHGVFISIEVITQKIRKRLVRLIATSFYNFLGVGVTFTFWCFTCIFFRASTVSDALYVISNLFVGWKEVVVFLLSFKLQPFINSVIQAGLGYTTIEEMGIAVGLIIFLEIVHQLQRKQNLSEWFEMRPIWVRWAVYYAAIISLLLLGVFNQDKFIYFQF